MSKLLSSLAAPDPSTGAASKHVQNNACSSGEMCKLNQPMILIRLKCKMTQPMFFLANFYLRQLTIYSSKIAPLNCALHFIF